MPINFAPNNAQANVTKIGRFNDRSCCKSIIYVERNLIIKRLLWRIIEIIFFRSVLISFSSISFHRSDIAFVNRYNRIFHILRAPRKIFSRIVGTSTSLVGSFQFLQIGIEINLNKIIRVNLHFCL